MKCNGELFNSLLYSQMEKKLSLPKNEIIYVKYLKHIEIGAFIDLGLLSVTVYGSKTFYEYRLWNENFHNRFFTTRGKLFKLEKLFISTASKNFSLRLSHVFITKHYF